MILRRSTLKPLCRQCGHELDQPVSRCPMCGMRTGMVVPLRVSPRQAIEARDAATEIREYEELDEPGDSDDDLVLEPPLARPPETPLALELLNQEEAESEPDDEPAPIPRNITLGGLMLGTLLIAICLGIGRASHFAGAVAFLVLVPAYIRTLSAIAYYRDRERQLGPHDIGSIYVTSLVLALMGLLAGAFAYSVVAYAGGKIVQAAGGEDSLSLTNYIAIGVAFVAVTWIIQRVWPANED